jgi:hypothetical protein
MHARILVAADQDIGIVVWIAGSLFHICESNAGAVCKDAVRHREHDKASSALTPRWQVWVKKQVPAAFHQAGLGGLTQ